MKEPVKHIIRPALPWRTGPETHITECGLNAASAPTVSRAEYESILKDMGVQRASLFTCMTCSNTAKRHGTWGDDPRQAMLREIEWERGHKRRGLEQLKIELLSIQQLIADHPDEFDRLVKNGLDSKRWVALKAKSKKSNRRQAHDGCGWRPIL